MATMVLKETETCNCGKVMFVNALDKENKVITYRCSNEACGAVLEKSFEEAKRSEGESIDYFCLNDDGEMTWKCFNHGYCDFNVEWFEDNWQDKVNRFLELACALDVFEEEMMEEFENVENHIGELLELFSHLEEEQIEAVAEEMGVMVEDDLYGAFCEDFKMCLIDGNCDYWEEYKENIIDAMFSLDLCPEE